MASCKLPDIYYLTYCLIVNVGGGGIGVGGVLVEDFWIFFALGWGLRSENNKAIRPTSMIMPRPTTKKTWVL